MRSGKETILPRTGENRPDELHLHMQEKMNFTAYGQSGFATHRNSKIKTSPFSQPDFNRVDFQPLVATVYPELNRIMQSL